MKNATLSGSAMKRNVIADVISALFILLFVYTALSKLMEWENFRNVLSRSPLINEKAPIVAITIPVIELIISLLLFIPNTRVKGLYLSCGLMLLFTLYISYMLAFAKDLPCSCGGVISQMSWTQHIYFNITFILLAFTAILLSKRRQKNNEEPDVPPVIFT